MIQPDIDRLTDLLRASRRTLVFTGAGVSTGSGIRDFRGPDGVWKQRQPIYYDDFMRSAAARVEHWDYKLESWPSFRDARPNASHLSVARLEQGRRLLMLVTQNIDGLHRAAGVSPERLVELHGTNAEIECQQCGARSEPEPHFRWFAEHRECPRCACGGWLKPATISFGQALRTTDLQRAFEAAERTDLVIALGSTLSVHPAASIPLHAAQRGCPYVIVNRGPTDHDGHPAVSLRIEGDVGEVFPAAVAAL